jgi:hypothetical protein
MLVFKIVLGYGLLRIIEAMVVKAIKENYFGE